MNIITALNGFEFNNVNYLFQDFFFENELIPYQIIGENQCHIGTNRGIILLDLSCTINEVEFTDINLFVQALTNEA